MKKIMILMTGMFILACNNEKDKVEEITVTHSDLVARNLKGDISSIESTPYKTDSTGKIGDMDSCCVSITEYDENGNSIKTVSKDSKGNLSNESVITRYPNGFQKSTSNTKNGKSTGSFNIEMDDKGNYIMAQAIDSNGKPDIYYTNLTSNEVGQITGWKQYDKDSVFRQSSEATYDGYKQMSNIIKDSTGKVKSSSASKYNDNGELTERSNTNVGKDSTTTTVTKYTYETHDEMGNWTQRTTWNDKGKATAISKRTITIRKKE